MKKGAATDRIGIAELKDHLSEHLHRVEAGAEIIVMHRQRPIARLVPIVEAGPVAVIIPARRPLTARDRRPSSHARWPISSTELLLEERAERDYLR